VPFGGPAVFAGGPFRRSPLASLLRHTFCTHLADASADTAVIRELAVARRHPHHHHLHRRQPLPPRARHHRTRTPESRRPSRRRRRLNSVDGRSPTAGATGVVRMLRPLAPLCAVIVSALWRGSGSACWRSGAHRASSDRDPRLRAQPEWFRARVRRGADGRALVPDGERARARRRHGRSRVVQTGRTTRREPGARVGVRSDGAAGATSKCCGSRPGRSCPRPQAAPGSGCWLAATRSPTRSGLAAHVVFRVIHAVGVPAFGVPAVR
jgi:hypothetical protein